MICLEDFGFGVFKPRFYKYFWTRFDQEIVDWYKGSKKAIDFDGDSYQNLQDGIFPFISSHRQGRRILNFEVLFRRPQKYDEISQLFLALLCKFKKDGDFACLAAFPEYKYELEKGIICIGYLPT